MCQRDNHYREIDATREYAWKVMLRNKDTFKSYIFMKRKYKKRKIYTAIGKELPNSFSVHDTLNGGAFHVFTRLEDAVFVVQCAEKAFSKGSLFKPVLVQVAVSEYIASGCNLDGSPTACYRKMMIVDDISRIV